MIKFKKLSLLLLALLLVLSFVACTSSPPPAEPIDTPPEEPPYEENGDDDYILPEPPIGDLEDGDVDWSLYPVIIDGVGVPGSSFEMIGEDAIFPTHVGLMSLERVLGVDVFWNLETGYVSFQGLNGFINFVVGSADFEVDGETITLDQESVRIGDELYVPISFFRDVFGAGSAYFSGGHVIIDMEGEDMY
ncbi:MAG: copper amine oxidase N-terminal domain-containing protein [Oscillospiraceae bacterium]|nr:copper amine oxidase N-terminal domain-containing protein [Oscillospiraceae bacterium]